MLSTTFDPANRLVAANLERRWNDALVKVEELREHHAEFQATQGRAITPGQALVLYKEDRVMGGGWIEVVH